MPSRRNLDRQPSDYVVPGQEWPGGALIEESPLAVHFVKELAMELKLHCDERSVYAVAKGAEVNAQTIFNFLNGKTWGDVVVFFRLEHEIQQKIWSHDHLSPGWEFKIKRSRRA